MTSKKFRKAMTLLLTAVMLFSMSMPAFADGEENTACTKVEGCTLSDGHEGDCVLPTPAACTKVEGCTLSDGHEGDCVLPTPAACTKVEGCTLSDGHEGECVLPTPVACTKVEGCTLSDGHEGECVLPAPVACTKVEGCTLTAGHEGDCVLPTPTLSYFEQLMAAESASAMYSIFYSDESAYSALSLDELSQLRAKLDAFQYTEGSEDCDAQEDLLAAVTILTETITGEVDYGAYDSPVKIGETGYASLEAAITAANAMSGNVTVEIYGKVVYSDAAPSLGGAYDSIKFVGKSADAEISITRNGTSGYISGGTSGNDCSVSYENLILSKPEGAFANDAGFMNVYFSTYRVASVTYTNCIFPDGACSAGCPTTFTGCTFDNDVSGEYSLWVYGNTNTTVSGGSFTGIRGVKMYSEGAAKTSALTLSGVTFSVSVTEKPAIVLTYGASVTLSGNTYNNPTPTFELDSDGSPDGTSVTSDKDVSCKNDDGACGVMVDGKIYTSITSANSAGAITASSDVTLYYSTDESLTLPVGASLRLASGVSAPNVTVAEAEAKIGSTTYPTLAEALSAAESGSTITLLKNISISAPLNITKSVTIDGGDKELSYTGTDRAITVENSAAGVNLSLKNLTVNAANAQRAVNYNTNGTLSLERVIISANPLYGVNLPTNADGAKVNITGCTINARIPLNIWGSNMTVSVTNSGLSSTESDADYDYAAIQLNNNGSDVASGTTVSVTGGSISALNHDNKPGSAVSNWTGSTVNISSSTTVTGSINNVAARTASGAGFLTLEDAIKEADKGGFALIMLRSSALGGNLSVSNNISIDAAGYKISKGSSFTGLTLASGKAITITNSGNTADEMRTLLGSSFCISANGSTITIKSGHTTTGSGTCISPYHCSVCNKQFGTGNHALSYTSSGYTITERCTRSGCTHSATASLQFKSGASTAYTGHAVKPLEVVKSSGWLGGDLNIAYRNNVNPGTATATISVGNVSVSASFTIATTGYVIRPVERFYLRNSGKALTFTTNIPYGSDNLTGIAVYNSAGKSVAYIDRSQVSYIKVLKDGNGYMTITLQPNVMNQLKNTGKYTLVTHFNYGSASDYFHVVTPTSSPATGDTANFSLWTAMLFGAMLALGGTGYYLRKNRKTSKD